MSEQPVASDPKLGAKEREFTLRFATDEERATVHTEIPSVMRALLSREDVEILRERQHEKQIVAVKATVPIGAVKVQQEARNNNHAAPVVSSHD